MHAITIVAAVFLLSLLGAVILFKFFESTALIREKAYQAGGAFAGFVIIYGLLFTSYYRIEQLKNEELTQANTALAAQVSSKLGLAVVSGIVQPDKGPVKVRLVVDAQEPDSMQGRFNFQVPRVLLDNPTMALYAVTDDEHVILDANCVGERCELPESSVYLFGQTKLDDIKMAVKLRRR